MPGPALHRQPMRLVEHHDAVIAVETMRSSSSASSAGDREAAGLGLRPVRQGRDADLLALQQAGIGLGPLAVHADLAGAQHLLQRALGELGEVAAEPAVEPGIRVGGDDGAGAMLMMRRGLPPRSGSCETWRVARRKIRWPLPLNHEDAIISPQGGTIGAVRRQTAP